MIAFDTSGLIKRYVDEQHSAWVEEVMDADRGWGGSTLLAAETAIVLARTEQTTEDLALVDARVSRDLEFFDMVPMDADCLVNAIQLGRAFGLRTLDAIHLAAFRAMPAGCRVVTFDERLGNAAQEIGLTLLTPA